MRTARSVVEEIEHWYSRGYRRIDVDDDNFTWDRQRMERMLSLLEEKDLAGLTLGCSNGLRADRMDRDLLERMFRVGFRELRYGVETRCDKTMKALGRETDKGRIDQIVALSCEIGFTVRLNFMVGSPSSASFPFPVRSYSMIFEAEGCFAVRLRSTWTKPRELRSSPTSKRPSFPSTSAGRR